MVLGQAEGERERAGKEGTVAFVRQIVDVLHMMARGLGGCNGGNDERNSHDEAEAQQHKEAVPHLDRCWMTVPAMRRETTARSVYCLPRYRHSASIPAAAEVVWCTPVCDARGCEVLLTIQNATNDFQARVRPLFGRSSRLEGGK